MVRDSMRNMTRGLTPQSPKLTLSAILGRLDQSIACYRASFGNFKTQKKCKFLSTLINGSTWRTQNLSLRPTCKTRRCVMRPPIARAHPNYPEYGIRWRNRTPSRAYWAKEATELSWKVCAKIPVNRWPSNTSIISRSGTTIASRSLERYRLWEGYKTCRGRPTSSAPQRYSM